MKTIQEQIAVMQHFAAGGKVELQYTDGSWKLCDAPQWSWLLSDYRIAEGDPYAELKAAAADPRKQIRDKVANTPWYDSTSYAVFALPASHYEIRDKPKPPRKIKLLAWLGTDHVLRHVEEGYEVPYGFHADAQHVPAEDKEIEVEDD